MAFIFPEDKATFTAPNGITYAWKDDHWVVQKFMGDHEVYVSPTPPDDPEEGKLWYDSTGNVIELFIYVDGAWVSATPSSEYALEARIAANEEGIRDLWTDQQRQDFELAGLDHRVDQLEGKVGEYRYLFQTTNATPRDGQMALLKRDLSTTTRWEEAELLSFNPTTLSGETFDVSEVVTGDVIRLFVEGDISLQVSAFEVKVIQNDNGLLQISQKVKSVGTGMDGATYEVEHLKSFDPAGLATMDYVNAQDELLMPKTGDIFTGPISFERGSKELGTQFSISPNPDSDYATNIYSFNNGEIRLRSSHTDKESDRVGSHIILRPNNGQPETRIYKVVNPTTDDMAANKRYVDSVAGGLVSPPGLRFKFVDTFNVQEGEFYYGEVDGKIDLRLNNVSRDVTWNYNGLSQTISYREGHIFTIYNVDSNGRWRIVRQGTIEAARWESTYVAFSTSSAHANGSLSKSYDYYITIAGIV